VILRAAPAHGLERRICGRYVHRAIAINCHVGLSRPPRGRSTSQ